MLIAQIPPQVQQNIVLPIAEIIKFCDRWQIIEFALFGSVLRDDFRPDSDVDVLISLSKEAKTTLFDLVRMQEELITIFKREVDLVLREGIERSANYLRREAILSSAVVVYEQRNTVLT
jgi:predicted nucleotidyltransferase